MNIRFDKPVLLESFVGTSKAGREYGRIRFATQDFDVFEIFCPADSARSLSSYEPKTTLNSLTFFCALTGLRVFVWFLISREVFTWSRLFSLLSLL